MAEITVFVDTAVLGTFPPICVKDGVPTSDRLTLDCAVNGGTGLGVAWLLVLVGPLGWLALVLISLMRRPADSLTVRLPFSEHAYDVYLAARRMQRTWLLAAFVTAILALICFRALHPLGALAGGVVGMCALGALIAGVVEWHRTRVASVRVDLDASRRWVTLSGVHPDFANAVGQPHDSSARGIHR
ncbi:MAG: hypothetical protein ACRDWE_02570 [Acidimicrobiales bacterium]